MTISILDETTGQVFSMDKLEIPVDLAALQNVSVQGIARVISQQVNAWDLVGDGLRRIASSLGGDITGGTIRLSLTTGSELHFGIPNGNEVPVSNPRVRLLYAARQIVTETGLMFDENGVIMLPTEDGCNLEMPVPLMAVAV